MSSGMSHGVTTQTGTTIAWHIQDEEVALLKISQTFLRIPLEMKNTSSLYDKVPFDYNADTDHSFADALMQSALL